MTLLDTNAIIWIYYKKLEMFPKKILSWIEKENLFFSPIVKLELDYLCEVSKLEEDGQEITSILKEEIGLELVDENFSKIIECARKLKWTRDPFDRLLVAHVDLLNAFLITKDQVILKNYKKAIW